MKKLFKYSYSLTATDTSEGGKQITGRAFSNYGLIISFAAVVGITVCIMFMVNSFVNGTHIPLIPVLAGIVSFILLLIVQPETSNFSILISGGYIDIRFMYLGITLKRLRAPLFKLMIEEHYVLCEKKEDFLAIDFIGDWDTDYPYVTASYQGKRYGFSMPLFTSDDNRHFEARLWELLVDAYNGISVPLPARDLQDS